MKLSIILPVYNMEKYLHRSINSLMEQDLPKDQYEIIIVNDESKDNSLKIARELASRHSNIVIVDKKNGGTGAARNSGLAVAKGEYIHFVDPDDYIAKNVYGTLINFADDKNLDILTIEIVKTTSGDLPETTTDMDTLNLDSIEVMDGISYLATTNYNNACWWYIINRKFMDSTGHKFIEGRWMEDSIITPQWFLKAKRVADMPLDVYRYMVIPNSARTSKDPSHYHKFIYDIESATYVFDGLLEDIPTDTPEGIACKKRIKTRQQSFVFFMLFRFMKSNLPIKKLPEMLNGFKSIDAYPLDQFPGEDFNDFKHKSLAFIYTREKLTYLFMRLFRFFYVPYIKFMTR